MKVAITGASGLIGSRLVAELGRRGDSVVALTRGEPPDLSGMDGVVNLAGEPVAQRWTAAAKERIRSSRVERTKALAAATNPECLSGSPAEVLDGADLFIGLSGERVIEAGAIARMNADPIVFAMANPTPEVLPEEAAPYAPIIATGSSDYPNQINNVLCFPGIFRGALDTRAAEITEGMKMAAARAIAGIVSEEELREDYIIPSVFNRDVAGAVAAAVADEARRSGTASAGAEVGFAN